MFDIGIHVELDLWRTRLTCESLRQRVAYDRLFLLAEPGVPDVDRVARESGASVVRLVRAGGATAFNALLEVSGAPEVAFLESGAGVAPGALERLRRALGDSIALAGPSTNRAWNEQRQPDAPRALQPLPAVDAYAAALGDRCGDDARELVPLHSLSDFCVVVRREPLAALGGADTAYDPGPCWEMDLNVRAHRAGWRGVWVVGAYVHRAPLSTTRRGREREFFQASRRRFQERFCARFLRGGHVTHRDDCRGDACPNFAPAPLLRPFMRPGPLVRAERAAVAEGPLVSCIMPTRGRPAFVAEAVRAFLAQDYPLRELVVVDDGEPPIAHLLPVDVRVRYLRLPAPETIGAKRNIACEAARGELIAHFDDDDWYPPGRLTAQVRALAAAPGADLCGTSRLDFIEPATARAWLYSCPGEGRLAGTSLMYRRSFWQRHRFQPVQVGEDGQLVRAAVDAGAGVLDLRDRGLCVATIHDGNSSPRPATTASWREIPGGAIEARLGERAAAYRAAAAGRPARLPLVSCMMPTRGRPEFVALAIEKFEAQDYPEKELVVLDEGDVPVADLVAGRPNVRYHRLQRDGADVVTVGEKRNIACELSRGEIICCWDDDDWYAPDRLRCQVLPIVYGEADLTGLRCDLFLCLPSGDVWTVNDDVHRRMFEGDVAGGTVAFHRRVFEEVRFPHINLAEDAAMIRVARARGCRLKAIPGRDVFVYVRHPWNTWRFEPGQFYQPAAWSRADLPPSFTPAALAAHHDAYRAWRARYE
jgi:glycosyltransferase involved in cell wall biosynthesis